jgi:superfamily II DNA or RNA helicase
MTKQLGIGLYELLITAAVEAALTEHGERLVPIREDLEPAEAAQRIAFHLAASIERALESVGESERRAKGIQVAQELLSRLDELIDSHAAGPDAPVEPGTILRALVGRHLDGSEALIESPLIPLLDTTLLTNAPGEPRVGRQLEAEIASADQIDLLMAFIRYSGVLPLKETLRQHRDEGRSLRVLTTTYTGSTERRALDLLRELGAEIRVSYDTSTTRLHAKAWLFHRESGFSTAYIGSSNLTHSAQVTGLEWNVRVSAARNRDVLEKVRATFESYWESHDFRPYDAEEFDRRSARDGRSGPAVILSPIEIRPEAFQERLLEELAISRSRGFHRNLLAAATGTGKTVMAALDYIKLRSALPRSRLLFIAHRQEILDQSQAIFRQALQDAAFGEQWVAGRRPLLFEHVFASVQSLRRADLDNIPPDHFDVLIIDEFHHAAAPSYDRLLNHLDPRETLGLTATPERADGLPVLHWFGDRIAAELRLWDAIDQHYLSPFLYFGVHDGLDLTQVPWRRGVGYDAAGLTNLYTASDAWARRVVKEFLERIDDLAKVRALGFCVSIEHAQFMARVFSEAGIASVAIWGDSSDEARRNALSALRAGHVKILFSVDLFNEGLDLPTVNTLLLLRPTDSPTLFLQQLGRGLRRADGKAACTVLDFVGIHRKEFRFDRRYRALLGGTRQDVERHIKNGFPFLPAGCHMQLDPVASDIVLRSIRESIPSRWRQKVEELRALVQSGRDATLAAYLEHSALDLEDIYAGSKSWSELCADAGVRVAASGPEEAALRRAVGRLLHVDDDIRLNAFIQFASQRNAPIVTDLNEQERRLLRMLVASLGDQALGKDASLQDGAHLIWKHPQILSELVELFGILRRRTDHLHIPMDGPLDVPLRVHARYTRVEVLAAYGVGSGATVGLWQTGVRWLPDANVDLLAFTLDKTEGHFSPTTRYRDYAISPSLIHWESQSVTRADSETGLRYQNHVAQRSEVVLFARLRQTDRAFWCLGPAEYVRHAGERPMAVTWHLRHHLPGDLFAAFAAAAGA